MVQDFSYGLEVPVVSPAYRYAKRILNDAEQAVKGVTSIPGVIADVGRAGAGAAKKTGAAIPIVLGILAIGVAGYLIFMGKKGTRLAPDVKL
jgi:hypothetical protein